MSNRVRLSVDPIFTIRGKRWVVTMTHQNGKQLLFSGNRYANEADAETVVDGILGEYEMERDPK